MKKIIIAIDSFKSCLTSAEAGKAAEKGIKSINPFCHTSVIPIADGGEGLLDVLITWRVHVVVMGAKSVEDRGELPEVMLELLLPLTYILDAFICGQVVKLTRQGPHIILKSLLHVVHSSHKWITKSFLDVRAKFRKLRVQRIKVTILQRTAVIFQSA